MHELLNELREIKQVLLRIEQALTKPQMFQGPRFPSGCMMTREQALEHNKQIQEQARAARLAQEAKDQENREAVANVHQWIGHLKVTSGLIGQSTPLRQHPEQPPLT